MIVVLGRPALVAGGAEEPEPGRGSRGDAPTPAGLAARIALAAAAAGSPVELVGTIGDDADGDAVALALGRAGVGHAALLRDPAGSTAHAGAAGPAGRPPRLEPQDVDLGLRYLADYRVLVLAEPLPPPAEAVALEAARYQGAAVIAVVPQGAPVSRTLREAGTVLEAPTDGGPAFAELVARYAAGLDSGQEPRAAFEAARLATGFEPGA